MCAGFLDSQRVFAVRLAAKMSDFRLLHFTVTGSSASRGMRISFIYCMYGCTDDDDDDDDDDDVDGGFDSQDVGGHSSGFKEFLKASVLRAAGVSVTKSKPRQSSPVGKKDGLGLGLGLGLGSVGAGDDAEEFYDFKTPTERILVMQ